MNSDLGIIATLGPNGEAVVVATQEIVVVNTTSTCRRPDCVRHRIEPASADPPPASIGVQVPVTGDAVPVENGVAVTKGEENGERQEDGKESSRHKVTEISSFSRTRSLASR